MTSLTKKYIKAFATAAALTTALSGCVTMGGNASPYSNGPVSNGYNNAAQQNTVVMGNGPACRAFTAAQRRSSYSDRYTSRGVGDIVGGLAGGMFGGNNRGNDRKISRGLENIAKGTFQGMSDQRKLNELRSACEAETRQGYCETKTYESSYGRTRNGQVAGGYEGTSRQDRRCTISNPATQKMPTLRGLER